MYVKIFIGFFLLQNVLSFTNILRLNNPKLNNPKLNNPKLNKYNNKNSLSMIKMIKEPTLNNFENFDWKKNWYPIALEEYTDKKKPFKFTLLGENLVIWWDNINNKWCSTDNKCSHRLAPLSEGRINTKGNIECPYHGWCFNSTGNCVKIPHRKHNKIDSKFNIKSLHTETKQGIIWVWPEKYTNNLPNTTLIPISPLIKDKTVDFSLDVPYDYSLLIENVMDFSHVPYTHHNNQGNRYTAKSFYKYKILENINSKGFKLKILEGISGNNTVFKAPCYTHTDFKFVIFKIINLFVVIYAIPKSPGYSRLIIRLDSSSPNKFLNFICKKIQFLKPTFLRHMARNEVFEEDTPILYYQEKELLLKNKNYYNYNNTLNDYIIASGADTPSVLFRKWLNKVGPIPWNNNKNKKLFNENKNDLFNREKYHFEHCTACQKEYNKLQLIKKITVFVKPAIFLILWPFLYYYYPNNSYMNKLITIPILILTSIIWYICNELQIKMKVGKYTPRRNNIKN